MIIKYIFSFADGLAAIGGFDAENPGALDHCPQFSIVKEGKGVSEMGFTMYIPSMVSRFTVESFEKYLQEHQIEHEKLYLEMEAENGKES